MSALDFSWLTVSICTERTITPIWTLDEPVREHINAAADEAPQLRRWLATTVGPDPNAARAYGAALQILRSPEVLYTLVSRLFPALYRCEDYSGALALICSFEAALLDWSITSIGTRKPWFENTGFSRLELRTTPVDLEADREDIETLWESGLRIPDLFDAGSRCGPADFPISWSVLTDALAHVSVEGPHEDAYEKVQALLLEAQEARQWSIPWGARVEIHFAPFVAVKIFERDGEFACHFLDAQERYFHVPIGLQGRPPRIGGIDLLRKRVDDGDVIWNYDAEIALQLIAAAIVRDFLVVEDRESLFTRRLMRKRIGGRNVHDIIYLPRVRYAAPHPADMSVDEADAGRARHQVAPHLRRAGTASTAQRFLAQRYGMELPSGFTFVRPHERGTAALEARIKVYRSRSASRMIFDEVAKAPEGSRPEWFEFEKDCARLLQSQGMTVVHQAASRSGDIGVDLYAVDAGGQSWAVQCKCWAAHRPVGPEVVRELVGAIAASDRGMSTKSKGMLITTSKFTTGAASEAIANGFELYDGERLAKLLA